MTDNEAKYLIDKLKFACNFHRFNEAGVVQEYTKIFFGMDYKRADMAISKILETESRSVPAISDLIKTYRELGVAGNIRVENGEWCATCNDKGIILVKEAHGEHKECIYEIVTYCPYCLKGTQFAYDGSKCTKIENKSPYKLVSVAELLTESEINNIRRANREKQRERFKGKQNFVGRRTLPVVNLPVMPRVQSTGS